MHTHTPKRSAEGAAPRTDEEALGLLRGRVPDAPSFWAPAVEYQLARKAGAPVEEAADRAVEQARVGVARVGEARVGRDRRPSPVW